ncbi:hypothetical protein PG997_003389 [Apiospora hydei]|uniref:C2H2-type domain-containing protein n=1 Tax=Apiospora hydei TaxID=1337664 RepID=A0ABR1WZ58_9PEZI
MRPDWSFPFVNPSWVQSGNEGPLPEWSWDDLATADEPAGQDGQVEEATPPRANEDDDNTSNPQIPPQNNSNDPHDPPEPAVPGNRFQCPECPRYFRYKKQLTTHLRTHTRPFHCQVADCGARFALKKDLERHAKEVHSPTRWYCTVQGCKYKLAVEGTARKANLDRHMRTQHGVAAP